MTQTKTKKDLGQYFTVSQDLQQFVFDAVKHKGAPLLEPSFGAGHLLAKFKEYDENYPMVCYELDATVKPVVAFNEFQRATYGDFTAQTITQRFKTIVGNPPYVKQRTGNLYIKFIDLCHRLLDEDGEMVFIVPSDFLKLTSAAAILERMTANGRFTDFWFPNDEKLFPEAAIDVVVFRYERGAPSNQAIVNGKRQFYTVTRGIVTFSDAPVTGDAFEESFHVYVGLVSGRDEIYRAPFGNIDLLTDKGRQERFIFPTAFPTGDTQIDAHLGANKTALLGRKIKKFSETNWFEWGAPRNLSSIQAHWGKPCIYVRNMTRQKEVAFKGTVQYFGGSLLCMVPKEPMTDAEADRIVAAMNTEGFQKDYLYAGRFKIGHKQLSNAILPQ